ncbi:MAG: permease [Candidatus Zixiibacteriota bacterium]
MKRLPLEIKVGLILFFISFILFMISPSLVIDNIIERFYANMKIIFLALIAICISIVIHFLVPVSLIEKHMSGGNLLSYFIAGILGMITPGPTICIYPIILVLHKKGISYPVLVSYITGQTLIGPARIPYEVGILGPNFFIYRVLTAIVMAPLAGMLFGLLPGRTHRRADVEVKCD